MTATVTAEIIMDNDGIADIAGSLVVPIHYGTFFGVRWEPALEKWRYENGACLL